VCVTHLFLYLSVGIALGYGLEYGSSRVRFPAGAENFSLHYRVQNGSGAHTASYPIGSRSSFPGGKAAGAWTWNSPSSRAEVKEWVELYLHSRYRYDLCMTSKGKQYRQLLGRIITSLWPVKKLRVSIIEYRHLDFKHVPDSIGKPKGKRQLGRQRRRWEDNIRLDLRDIGWDVVDWIHLAKDRDQWRVLVNTITKIRVP
jgi:hypothetical protein